MQSLKKRSVHALGWDLIGKYANQGTSFIISIFLARILDPRDFGLIAMASVFIGLSQAFTDMGLGKALVQAKSPSNIQINTVFYLNVLLGVALSLLFMIAAGPISVYFEEPEIKPIVLVMSVVFIITGFNVVQIALYTRELNFKVITQANLLAALLSGGCAILLAAKGYGVWSLVIQSLIFAGCKSMIIWIRSSWRPGYEFELSSATDLFRFGNKVFLAGFINTVFQKLDVLVIGKLFTAADLGYFFRAKSFNTLLVRLTSASLGNVLFPVFSQLQDNRERVNKIFFTSLELISFLVFGLMGVFFINGEQLIVFLFSAKWLPSVIYFKIFILRGYAVPLNSLYMNLIKGLGFSGLFLRLELIKKFLFGIAVVVGIQYDILGFVIALVVLALINTLINLGVIGIKLHISTRMQASKILPYALLSFIISYIIVLVLDQFSIGHFWHISISGTLFLSIYLLAIKLSGLSAVNILDKHLRELFGRIPIKNDNA